MNMTVNMQTLHPSDVVRPHPDVAAPDDLAPGDVVEVVLSGWDEGEIAHEATVCTAVVDGRVGIVIEAGTERRRYSAELSALRLIRRAA